MVREQVVASLKRLFADRGVDIGALPDDADLAEHLGWDSMDIVDLGMEFERRHGVMLPQDVSQICSIAQLCARLAAPA